MVIPWDGTDLGRRSSSIRKSEAPFQSKSSFQPKEDQLWEKEIEIPEIKKEKANLNPWE